MMNFGPLAAEIRWRVWGTPANFNRFRVLAALLHGTVVVGVSQTAALNRGRHLYSAGRPSRWALAHILVAILKIFFQTSAYIPTFEHHISKLQPICTVSLIFAMLSPNNAPKNDTHFEYPLATPPTATTANAFAGNMEDDSQRYAAAAILTLTPTLTQPLTILTLTIEASFSHFWTNNSLLSKSATRSKYTANYVDF